jgi:branched-subunit amino acid aminotransferase/4-amino-4-deoxychorismate lyase
VTEILTGERIPVVDSLVARGDGVFEAIRSYDGVPFALEEHLDRLERSARSMELEPPPRGELAAACRKAGAGDVIIRILLSRGDAIPGTFGGPRCVVLSHPVTPAPQDLSLAAVPAPWHPAGRAWELAGVKTTSYAPNLAASREAVRRGCHDALLVADDGTVLEGPTFSVAWVRGGALETPGLDLGILGSITRAIVLDLAGDVGVEVVEGRFPLERLLGADEVLALSTVKEVAPVLRVDETRFEEGPVTRRLGDAFEAEVDRRRSVP